MDTRNNFKLNFLLGLFVAIIIGMNTLGVKITSVFGVSVSVAIFMMPITFLITDVVSEVHGRKLAQQFVLIGLASMLIIMAYTGIFVHIKADERYIFNEEYKIIFGSSLRIMLASIIAFAISQTHDVWAFDFWRRKTQNRFLWLRNNASTMVSQAIDTLVFMFVAFYKVAPKFDAMFVIKLAIPYYIFKIVFALLDTPFVYLGVGWLKKKSPKDENQSN